MPDEAGVDRTDQFKLERLKFVLQQIDRLNERFHKYITLFQALTTAIIGAGTAVFVGWPKAGISAEATRAIIRGLLGLLVLLGLFVSVFVVTGIISWRDFRNEEARILDDAVKPGYRRPARLSNLWRWHETYSLVLIGLTLFLIVRFTSTALRPLIGQPAP